LGVRVDRSVGGKGARSSGPGSVAGDRSAAQRAVEGTVATPRSFCLKGAGAEGLGGAEKA